MRERRLSLEAWPTVACVKSRIEFCAPLGNNHNGDFGRSLMQAIIGLLIILVAGLLFWRLLPRNGKLHAVCDTWMEPYAIVAVMCAASIGFGLIATSMGS
jgi:hypothetical protein